VEPGTSTEKPTHVPSQKEVFYTAAEDACIVARSRFAEFSFQQSRERIRNVKRIRESETLSREEDEHAVKLYMHYKVANLHVLTTPPLKPNCTLGPYQDLTLTASQFADERPSTCVRYSPGGGMLLTGSLSALAKAFNADTLEHKFTLIGHKDRVTSVCWAGQDDDSALCLTSSADYTAIVWARDRRIGHTLRGHEVRVQTAAVSWRGVNRLQQGIVACVSKHPFGCYAGTASHDYTWRLWDIETGQQLWLQDGTFDSNWVARALRWTHAYSLQDTFVSVRALTSSAMVLSY
jgi:WD40 repeat protein